MSSTDKIILPELLCPAGDLTRLKTAVDFGADAVYIAGEEFGMRTAPTNFTMDQLKLTLHFPTKIVNQKKYGIMM